MCGWVWIAEWEGLFVRALACLDIQQRKWGEYSVTFRANIHLARYTPCSRLVVFLFLLHNTCKIITFHRQIAVWKDSNICKCLPAGLYGGGLEQPCVAVWVHLWHGSQYELLHPPGPGWPLLHLAHTALPGSEESLKNTHRDTHMQLYLNGTVIEQGVHSWFAGEQQLFPNSWDRNKYLWCVLQQMPTRHFW